MLTTMPGRERATDPWLDETFAALSRMPVMGPTPGVLSFSPYYSGNPFQALLYSQLAGQSLVSAPALNFAQVMEGTANWPKDVPLIFHQHWLNQVMAKAATEAEARKAMDGYVKHLDNLVARGARMAWTIHNVLPHDTVFENLEVELRQAVVDRAELIHVMSPQTVQMMSPWLQLPPEKVYRCDHPGYHGVYPDWVTRQDARQRLRIPDGAVALLLMGALKPYKGLAEIFDAVKVANDRKPGSVILIAAGAPDNHPETVEFLSRAGQHPSVRLLAGKIVDADMQVLLRASDMVALPYRRSLNSGVFALAMTFGRPALLPHQAGSSTLAPEASVLYDQEDPAALTEAVCALRPLASELEQAALAAGARIDRETVSRKFAADMRQWMDTGKVVQSVPGVASESVDLTPKLPTQRTASGAEAGAATGSGTSKPSAPTIPTVGHRA